MAHLPPNVFNSGVPCVPPDDAAVPATPEVPPVGAAAEFPDICEIFVGAAKLFEPDPAAYTNADQVLYDILKQHDDPHAADLIAIPEGMWGEFDPPPLFLRKAG